ncbi:PPOX class probable FMN-dependent enzyme [Hydrogenophaga palleronii]|uniref:PPOX class probable FMN-dependent enzyme n=1 Tax=Hydrogenophaga palleronii TaxID=65655 RepID=A0ABU1WFZ8_9BURK|nr:MSMEG_1061 family FMN-dependent PPOX-type flavoprotein [Hydrogenophaga palleronii]MDR7148118.1 PPOX class probable FMN-dependent enzyme [Hydrogenophaga palleronii]
MPITTPESLRALYNPIGERSRKKELPRLDEHITRFVRLSPLVVISSSDANSGAHDASPRGGAPGFVKVLDAHTLLLPDAPGNNRLDTLENIVSHGASGAPVGLLFLVPGVDETLRINGRAWLSTDEADLRQAAEAHRLPKLVVRVSVQSCYLHCAKALMRSQLWDASRQVERSALPSMGEMMRDQIRAFHGEETVAESQAQMLERYRQTL